jgi:CheY-like chemotaxis protein
MSTTKSILIVEDEAMVAEDLKEIVISLGYTVAGIADNGTAAIALAREKHPDLITMDISLSGSCDGITTMEQIRRHSEVPVIYVTAFATDPVVERAKRTRPSGYIIKPFNDRQVRTSIEIALHNYELEQKVTERDTMICTLINATENPLFLIDTAGIVLTANEAIAVRAKKTPEELRGIHVQQLIDNQVITAELGKALLKALEGTEVRFEESVQGYWFENLCIPVTDPSEGRRPFPDIKRRAHRGAYHHPKDTG